MSYQHQELASGRWAQLSFAEQMANVGSEVIRALNWKTKNHADYCRQAGIRALELMDLTLEQARGFTRLKELARTRETLVDYFFGANEYHSTEKALKNYFLAFNFSARK